MSSMLANTPMSANPCFRSVAETEPTPSMSKILNASNVLKSCLEATSFLCASTFLSRQIYSLIILRMPCSVSSFTGEPNLGQRIAPAPEPQKFDDAIVLAPLLPLSGEAASPYKPPPRRPVVYALFAIALPIAPAPRLAPRDWPFCGELQCTSLIELFCYTLTCMPECLYANRPYFEYMSSISFQFQQLYFDAVSNSHDLCFCGGLLGFPPVDLGLPLFCLGCMGVSLLT